MHEVFGVTHFDEKGVLLILFSLSLIEVFIGAFQNSPRTFNDYITEVVSFVQLTVFIQPAIIPVSYTHLDVYKRQGVERSFRAVLRSFRMV